MRKISIFFLGLYLSACALVNAPTEAIANPVVKTNSTASAELFAEIMHMDTLMFTAANSQDLAKMKTLFTKDLEWFQDNDTLRNYAETMASFAEIFKRENKPTRTLVPDTSEVYPIKDFGAVQLGKHQFCILENGTESCGIFGFIHLWKVTDDGWKIAKVISYGH